MKREFPATSDEAKEMTKDYPHTKEELTKSIVTTKLKNIRTKYRKAVDSGKRSGHGRVVTIYFDLCEKIWGGSPATTQISTGVESSDLFESPEIPSNEGDTNTENCLDQANDSVNSGQSEDSESSTIQRRREQLDNTLKTYRHSKMRKKLSQDAHVMAIATEELELKKKIIEQMEKMDQQHQKDMSKLTSSMDKISDAIGAFSTVFKAMVPQQNFYPSPQYSPYSPFPPSHHTEPYLPNQASSLPPQTSVPLPRVMPTSDSPSPGPYSFDPSNQ